VLIQEAVNWGHDHLIDGLTLFARRDAKRLHPAEPIVLQNHGFMEEAQRIREFHAPYHLKRPLWSPA
jgi:hypothetical protein